MDATDEQWAVVAQHLEMPRRPDGRGRPWRDSRAVFNDILWVLRTGRSGRPAGPIPAIPDLPPPLPALGPQGTFERVLDALATDLKERGGLDRSECFIDGTFVVAKKWGSVGATKRGKGSKLMAVADCADLPLAVCAASASPHETRLMVPTLDSRFLDALPHRLIGDRAYDADQLDAHLAQFGIEMIAPHRRGRVRPKTQDGRPLRRFTRRWKVERLFAWLGNFRRLVVLYERSAHNYLGFVHLGCILSLLRRSL